MTGVLQRKIKLAQRKLAKLGFGQDKNVTARTDDRSISLLIRANESSRISIRDRLHLGDATPWHTASCLSVIIEDSADAFLLLCGLLHSYRTFLAVSAASLGVLSRPSLSMTEDEQNQIALTKLFAPGVTVAVPKLSLSWGEYQVCFEA